MPLYVNTGVLRFVDPKHFLKEYIEKGVSFSQKYQPSVETYKQSNIKYIARGIGAIGWLDMATSTGSETSWLDDFHAAVTLQTETLQLIQERNSKYPDGGPESSRLTATARRRLGSLKSLIDTLQAQLESDACSAVSENEKNRRRNLLLGLRNDRDGMIQGLKRAGHRSVNLASRGVETDTTAEKNNEQLLTMQTALMEEQDQALEHLERSTVTTKHIALQINEETRLQNRLLEDFDHEVDETSNRLLIAQKRLKAVMQRANGCVAPMLLFVIIVILLIVLVLAFKIL